MRAVLAMLVQGMLFAFLANNAQQVGIAVASTVFSVLLLMKALPGIAVVLLCCLVVPVVGLLSWLGAPTRPRDALPVANMGRWTSQARRDMRHTLMFLKV